MTTQEKGDQHLEQENENNQPPRDQRELLNSLSANIYQLYEVQKHLYGDVKKFSEASQEFITIYQTFKGAVKDFSLLAPELRRQIRDIIQTSVTETLKSNETELGKTLMATTGIERAKLIESLNKSITNAERTLDNYMEETQWSRWMYVGTGVLSGGFIVALLVLFMKISPFAFVSESDVTTYRNGIAIEKAWPELTFKERKRIDDLAASKSD